MITSSLRSIFTPGRHRSNPYGTGSCPTTCRSSPYYAFKKAILIAAGGDKEEKVFDGMRASFKLATNFLGWEVLGEICAPDIYSRGDIEAKGAKWINKAKELGSSI